MKANIQWRFLAIAFSCLIFLPARSFAQSTEADPLVTLNNAFRAEYVKAKADALSKVGPLIIVEGNKVVLQRNGQRTETEILPPMYLSLKAIAHIPLAVFLVFEQLGNDQLTDARIAELQGYRKLILAARESLGQRGFTSLQLERQRRIINESLNFFDSVIQKKTVGPTELDGFAKRMSGLVLTNADDAAKAELDILHSNVTKWRQTMSADEWKNLHVVIISAHMPRDGELSMQYFQRLLDEPVEGRKIIFAEGLWEEKNALDLLGTHLVDGKAGEAFFGEFMRMHRDLLSDAAKKYIETLKIER